jgi:hypothetical protein
MIESYHSITMKEEKINIKNKLEWNTPSIISLDFKKTKDGDIPGLEEETDGKTNVTSDI